MPTRFGMVQARRRLRLAAEPVDEVGVARELREQHLDRDGTVEDGVHASVHLAHAARADPGFHPIPTPEHRSVQRTPSLARQVRLEDLTGDRRGHLATGRLAPEVATVQDDNRDRDRGDLVRSRGREADEPRVGCRVRSAVLRRAGLARDHVARDLRGGAGPAGHDVHHHRAHIRCGLLRDRLAVLLVGELPDDAPLRVADLRHQLGRHHPAAVRDRGRDQRHLQRVGQVVVLSDRGDGDERVVPLEVARDREAPGRERDRERDRRLQTLGLLGRIGRAEAVRVRLLRERVRSELQSDLAEDHVARVGERGEERGGRAAGAGPPAEVLDRAVGERQVELVRVRPHAVQAVTGLERRRRGDHLERRPRGEQLVVRAGKQRGLGIGVEALPRGADLLEVLRRQLVRIERGVRDHRQDVTAARVHRHHRARLRAQRGCRHALQARVDRGDDVPALLGPAEHQVGERRHRELRGVARQVGVHGLLQLGAAVDLRVVPGDAREQRVPPGSAERSAGWRSRPSAR